ncbi:MAG: pyruvate, phosphate dikinase [Bacilli bacterium]
MKYVYNLREGNKDMRSLLGGKGANLSEMCVLNLNVPSGFIITTDACKDYLLNKNDLNTEIVDQIIAEIKKVEEMTKKNFGRDGNTLLFSVRSGAPISMPGMMDTILNLGLNDNTVIEFASETDNEVMAYDCYRRLIQMYGNVVYGVSSAKFEKALENHMINCEVKNEREFSADNLKALIPIYKKIFIENCGKEFPQNVGVQLLSAVESVFSSWNNDRAKTYRKINKISDDLGTAVVVQEMVFGNYNDDSATGVLFSRNPNTGEKGIYGEFLINAQGEDVVAGIRTPLNIDEMIKVMPTTYKELEKIALYLEEYYKDMQDIEFTIENQNLFILQTRNAQRSNKAKIKCLLDMLENKEISKIDFIKRIDIEDVETYLFSQFDQDALKDHELFAKGLPASSGAASGKICFTEADVNEVVSKGEKAILVRNETSPEDISSMHYSDAIVTALGGMTSHAAVVARGMGKCCVCGATGLVVSESKKNAIFNNMELKLGDVISVNGTTGEVYVGEVPVKDATLDDNFYKMMDIIDEIKEIDVYANADEGNTGVEAIKYGAEGVGLVRTEHMFFEDGRLQDMQALIMSDTLDERVEFLKKMSKYQIDDFVNLLDVMETRPVSIRLLDPPLHEFLPKKLSQAKVLAEKLGITVEDIRKKARLLQEENPMLGHRGCRLAISYPEIYQMQVESIVTAVVLRKNCGLDSNVKILLPLITEENELIYLKKIIDLTTERLLNGQDIDINISLGVMIETPRAALISDRLSKYVDFFSYGTNDLTQLTYGFSRDDVAMFLPNYFEKNILGFDPFVSIDKLAVGKLVILSNQFGKVANPNLTTGICGEHGGDFESVQFAYNIGLDYVSCGPKRIPVAKLAAAKAVIETGGSCEKQV